ncbi:MAG: sigma-70 family RNA polymerase sigma factor [Candidatus Hydrogenedentes bacterium]|nr:sigma-70 family RNA polymerase sigma factor [Candidatus Hydrogenedentota bacterium]
MDIEKQIQASLKGDKEAFGTIVSQYQGVVCATAYSVTGNVHQSEDIAQEAFVVAWQRLGDLRDVGKLPAWLCGIARNIAKNLQRRMERDPLGRAGELSPVDAPESVDLVAALDDKEREALVWKTIEAIPLEYREPLVLFYREGQSVRNVAAALGVSEDCAKQRLARGRKMVKGHIAQVVETTLERTKPGTDLSTAVMGMLPVIVVQSAAAGTLGATTAKGAGAAGGLSAASMTALAGLAGPVIGTGGAFLGMWMSIRNSPSLRARRFMLKFVGYGWAAVWIFLGYLGACSAMFADDLSLKYLLCGLGWIAYVPALVIAIIYGNQGIARIAKEDFHAPIEESALSLRSVHITFGWTLAVAVIGSLGALWWLDTVPGASAIKTPAAIGLVLVHLAYAMLFRHGVRISRDQAAFDANPPIIRIDPQSGAPRPSPRVIFWNDLGALIGAVLGPMAGPITISFVSGRYVLGMIEVVVSIAVIAFGVTMARNPSHRRAGLVSVCFFMGPFCGGAWALSATATETSVYGPQMNPYWIAAIALAVYWVIGFTLYRMLPRADAQDQG